MTENEQEQIFKDWLGLYKGLIFKVTKAYAFTSMDQEDLFQEITVQVWHSIPSFRQESAVTTWIYRISLNTAIKWVKKERRHDPTTSLDSVEHTLQEHSVPIDERLTWLYEEIYKLDEIDRSVCLLLLDDFSYKEIASILGITESHVGVKINRLKKYLTAKTKKYDHHGI